MKIKKRKQRPSMPYYWWFDVDGCWFCKNKNACSNCKVARRYLKSKYNKRKRRRKLNETVRTSE